MRLALSLMSLNGGKRGIPILFVTDFDNLDFWCFDNLDILCFLGADKGVFLVLGIDKSSFGFGGEEL